MNPSIRNMPENFGGLAYQNVTNIHPLALAMVVICGIAVLAVPRRWSVFPMLIIACFVSSVQKITIVGMDFNLLRIMVVFGVVRLLLHKEHLGFSWKPLDTAIVLWTLSSMLIYSLQQATFAAVINRLGFGFDAFGMYFLFRCLIRNWKDVDTIIFSLLVISIPVALFFVLENRTGRNLFSVFGGVPAITVVREGRLRCQGAFSHAILAGCFWASVMPLMAAYGWKSAKGRVFSVIGVTMSVLIVVCCASSTPVLGVLSAVIGGLFFIFRRYMRIVRWSLLVLLVALHLMMQAPVWHLISRVSAVGGSTGWHRFNLINQAILNFGDWWLVGCSGDTVASWGIWAGDVTNQYLLMGVTGGIVTMLLFIAIIVIAFREVGRLWRSHANHPFKLALSWALGVSLFVHCAMFIGVSYFGQIYLIWYLLLAMIGSMSSRNVSSINQRKRKNLEY